MMDNELLTAMSDLLDSKLKSELQPIKDDIRDMKADVNGLKADMEQVKADVNGLKTDMEQVKADVDQMKTRISNLEEDVHGIHLHLENVTDKNIQLLAENYVPAAKRYMQTSDQIETIQSDVDLLKKTVTKHSEILQKFA